MIPDLPPMKREDLEAKITALLLGELPADEAALLRELIARDAGLARLHDRLKPALELLRETMATPEVAPAAPPKLSPERREKLLAHFKTVAPKEFAPPPHRKMAWLVALAAVASLMLLASLMLPALGGAKMNAQKYAIISNLRRLDAAKQQWAFEQRKSATEVPTMQDIQPYLGRGAGGQVPGGKDETYSLGAVGQPPVARWRIGSGKETIIALPSELGEPEALNEHAAAPASPSISFANGLAQGLTVTKSGESSEKPASLARQQPQPIEASNQVILPAPDGTESYAPLGTGQPADAMKPGIVAGASRDFRFHVDLYGTNEPAPAPLSSDALTPATPSASPEAETAARARLSEEEAFVGALKKMPQALLGDDRGARQDTDGKRDELKSAASADVEKAKAEANSSEGQRRAYNSINGIVLPASEPALGTQTGIASDLAAQLDKTAKIGTTNVYSLNAVGYMNLQAQPGYNILNTPLVSTPLSNEGNSNFTTPTATNSTPPVHGSVPILGGTPELGVLFANGAFDVTGQPFVIADHEITNYASDAGVSIRGVGLIDLGDASKDAGVETDNTPLTASKKLGLADNTDTAKLRDALRQRRSANQAKSTERADITYDFSAVPLEQLLDKYSELVGRNILRSSAGPEAVSKDATVTLKTQSPLTRSEAAAALEMVLGMNGITVVPVGDKFDKVVVEARAGMEGGIITTNANNLPESSKMVTQIVQVKNTDIKELADVLQPFSKTPKSVVALPSTQTLILRDSAENVDRMAEMIKKIDVPSLAAIKPEVIKIKYGLASDVASALSALGASGGTAIGRSTSAANFGGPSERASFQNNLNKVVQDAAGAGSSQILAKTKIIADERSNSLLIFANDDDKKKIEDILKKLDVVTPQPALPPPVPQPEVLTSTNIFSTFSLNVSDASFKLAAASLQNGAMPDAASIRSEEFINAFDYRDPEPAPGAPIGFAWERAGYPFAHHRDLLRFSVKTAAQGRQDGRPLNLVLLLDKSGSMERADRVEIIQQALRVLASQLHAQDTLSVVVFARTARLWVDGVPGSQAGEVAQGLSRLTPEGGTNLEEAMRLAYATALRHYQAKGDNRVVLLTDGAANLGDVNPETLQQKVEANGKQGIALDCFGVGWDGYNDNLMETLSRVGHGRYGFINTPEEAATEFAGKLAGALRVAASDVKVQVEFNPNRVTAYRQIGYARHQLTKEQFRDNTVAAAQIGAAESGNALYTVEVNPAGDGPLCTVHVRFRLPGTTDYQEHAWDVPYTGTAVTLDQASPALRLAATASAFSEWLAASPYAGEVTPDQLLADLRGVPEVYGADALPKKLEWMIRQAKSISGK